MEHQTKPNLLKQIFASALPDFIMTLTGTVIGIVLTFGVTYCSDKNDKEEMARKSVMMTLHNLDVSIRSMERVIDDMSHQDTIFHHVGRNGIDPASVSADTLGMFVAAMYSHNIRPIDTSTQDVFSSNFEIWRYIEDPKVIGRIANCYSILQKCGDEYERIEREKYNTFVDFYDSCDDTSRMSDAAMAAALMKQSKVRRIMNDWSSEISILREMLNSAEALNEHNKAVLRIDQSELDDFGRLL